MTPVLYLHGFASGPNSNKARYLREHLERQGIPVEVPDLGAGDFEHLTLTGQLAVVEKTRRGRALPLIGSSMGGYLAALTAARRPEIPCMVLLAPAFDFARRWGEHLGAQKLDEWRCSGNLEVFHYGDNQMRRLHYGLLEDAARYEAFPNFSQPALIFHGAQDDVVPATLSTQFAATHPNTRVEILDSGHELLNVLDYLAETITQFLKTEARRAPFTSATPGTPPLRP